MLDGVTSSLVAQCRAIVFSWTSNARPAAVVHQTPPKVRIGEMAKHAGGHRSPSGPAFEAVAMLSPKLLPPLDSVTRPSSPKKSGELNRVAVMVLDQIFPAWSGALLKHWIRLSHNDQF